MFKSENGTRSDSNPWLNEENVSECDWIINLESRFCLICFTKVKNKMFELMCAKVKMAQNLIESWIGRIDSFESDWMVKNLHLNLIVRKMWKYWKKTQSKL